MEILGVRLPFGGRNDDYDLDGDEEYDEVYEEGPGGTALQPKRRYRNEEMEEPEDNKRIKKFHRKAQSAPSSRAQGMEIHQIKPQSIDDAKELTDTLLDGRTVILNLEGIDRDIAQRIIDFACGSTYAVRGNLQNISNYIFVITPESVGISGDFPQPGGPSPSVMLSR